MSQIGPQLPPHTSTKRKRISESEAEDQNNAKSSSKQARRNADEIDLAELDDDNDDDDADNVLSAPPAANTSSKSQPNSRTTAGTTPPLVAGPMKNTDEIDLDGSDSETDHPPAAVVSLSQTTTDATADDETSSESDDDDDDYGPALPSASTAHRGPIGPAMPSSQESSAPLRDEWMLAPPTSTGYTERDTTKLKARKFVSRPSASSSTALADNGISALWTETPEEKLKRLQDSVLGRSDGSGKSAAEVAAAEAHSREEEARNRKIAASIAAHRGKSLYEEHQESNVSVAGGRGGERRGKNGGHGQEDDPSKRVFDREKDMSLKSKISTAQRNQLVAKSANFGGRFQKGSFL